MGKKIWTYNWRYLRTNQGSTTETDTAMTRLKFLELLNKWNTHGPGARIAYVYWETRHG